MLKDVALRVQLLGVLIECNDEILKEEWQLIFLAASECFRKENA